MYELQGEASRWRQTVQEIQSEATEFARAKEREILSLREAGHCTLQEQAMLAAESAQFRLHLTASESQVFQDEKALELLRSRLEEQFGRIDHMQRMIAQGNDAIAGKDDAIKSCLLYTSPSPRDRTRSRMPSSA